MRKSTTTGKKLIVLGFYVIFLHKNKVQRCKNEKRFVFVSENKNKHNTMRYMQIKYYLRE